MVAVRSHEDHGRCRRQHGQQVESGAAGEFDVQENGVRTAFPHEPPGLFYGGGFPGDVDIRRGLKQPAQIAACRRFIVDDHHAQHIPPEVLWRLQT